jgi:hypothetical protein
MPPDIPRHFAAARGMSHVDRIPQIELFRQRRQIVSVGVHVIAVPGLRRTPVTSAIGRDHAIATLAEEQHLRIPVVGAERPPMAEYDRLPLAPVFVENRCAVFGRNGVHLRISLMVSDERDRSQDWVE